MIKRRPYTGIISSPFIPTIQMVDAVDDQGNPIIIFLEDLNPQDLGYGSADDWSLSSMMKAGINPQSMHINTGSTTRLDSVDDLNSFISEANEILAQTTEDLSSFTTQI